MGGLDLTVLADILRESMARGQNPSLTLTSNSMYPLLKTGDRISIESVTPSDLRRGDIITLIDDSDRSQLLTHRFWGKERNGNEWLLVTRGDRPLEFDAPFAASKLIGRVISRQRDQHHLNLQTGSGERLNRWLTKVATTDLHKFTGIVWQETVLDPILLAKKSNQIVGQKQQTFYSRLWRKIHLSRAVFVVSLVDG